MEKPLMLVDGKFVLVELAFFKEEGVTLQGEFVGGNRPAEVILGDKVLSMTDLARSPRCQSGEVKEPPSETQQAWWRLYDTVQLLLEKEQKIDTIIAEVDLAWQERRNNPVDTA